MTFVAGLFVGLVIGWCMAWQAIASWKRASNGWKEAAMTWRKAYELRHPIV